MGFLDNLNKAISVASENVKVGANKVNENIKKGQDERFIKELILNKFEISEIKMLYRREKIGEPSDEKYNFSTGRTNKVRLTKSDYVEFAAKKLSLDTIKDFAKSKKIKFDDALVEERHLENERIKWRSTDEDVLLKQRIADEKFADIVLTIKSLKHQEDIQKNHLIRSN